MRFPTILGTGLTVALLAATTVAQASERSYFRNVQGDWAGSGKIVAGKYKDTRFTCRFKGTRPGRLGMKIAGTCRVGLFTQRLSAVITKSGSSYRGTFLDGAKGKGMDIVSGKLRGDKLVVGIRRKQLNGTMVANLKSENKLHISINVHASDRLVPVIGLTLNRTGRKAAMLTD